MEKLAVKAITAGLALAALIVAWVQLSTIQKSSQLAASQAVIDTYFRARDGVVDTEYQSILETLEAVKYIMEIDQLAPVRGSEARELADKLLVEAENWRNSLRDQALTDYATLVRHLCQQDQDGYLGRSASSFLRVVIAADVKNMPEVNDDRGQKTKQAVREMKATCK